MTQNLVTFNEACIDYMNWVEKVGRARKRSYLYKGTNTNELIPMIEKHFGVEAANRGNFTQLVIKYRGYELVVEVHSSRKFFLCLNY